MPQLRTRFRDRHALIVARGPGYKSDLRMVRPYIRDFRPVLVAVDGGADALREVGLAADMIVGDFDSVSDAALRAGAELVVHAYPGGDAPGAARLRWLGLEFETVSAPGISEDLALQLAHEKGATLLVAVGTHFNLVEFLERNRDGMASTFVTRLKVGESLVDAKGVSRLVSRRVGVWPHRGVRGDRDRRDRRRGARLAGAAERHRVDDARDRERPRALVALRHCGPCSTCATTSRRSPPSSSPS